MFNNVYTNKTVIVTGHTGFKGAWLCSWLIKLGANVIGISKDIPTEPSLFNIQNLNAKLRDHRVNIIDSKEISDLFLKYKPDFIFHLAAQPIVSISYADPIDTLNTNIIGTANILEAINKLENNCSCIIVTSDKCYENVEWLWGYKEDDRLGGRDIYSSSKAAAELVFKSYFYSFLSKKKNIRIATVRAGNVIGGGDWAKDRIVPDCVRSWEKSIPVEIRNPNSTRPWQHVLEPLSGYLSLAENLVFNENLNGESFNFGPKPEDCITVQKLINDLALYWQFNSNFNFVKITQSSNFHEAGLLKLNCEKAKTLIDWEPTLIYSKTVEFTSKWYFEFCQNGNKMDTFTINQIANYELIAKEKGLKWAQ